jgi:hypothetical protein
MPLVLAHNDVVRNPAHAWNDVEGVHYHYPSKYRSQIKTGEPFVYYRGVHRVGGKRGPAEYVGAGRIGQIWPDPKTEGKPRRAWYCGVEDYQRFPVPVAAKIDRVTLENIPRNLWRDGVRLLDPAVYKRIIESGRGNASAVTISTPVTQATISSSDALIVPNDSIAPVIDSSRLKSFRKSKGAKEVGDWAEAVAVRYIRESILGSTKCVHRASIGETPGWDIDYIDRTGALQRVEVKGTIAAAFTGVEITVSELDAMKTFGPNYWLFLVADCFTGTPKIQAIRDPASMLSADKWSAKPQLFSLRFAPSE